MPLQYTVVNYDIYLGMKIGGREEDLYRLRICLQPQHFKFPLSSKLRSRSIVQPLIFMLLLCCFCRRARNSLCPPPLLASHSAEKHAKNDGPGEDWFVCWVNEWWLELDTETSFGAQRWWGLYLTVFTFFEVFAVSMESRHLNMKDARFHVQYFAVHVKLRKN